MEVNEAINSTRSFRICSTGEYVRSGVTTIWLVCVQLMLMVTSSALSCDIVKTCCSPAEVDVNMAIYQDQNIYSPTDLVYRYRLVSRHIMWWMTLLKILETRTRSCLSPDSTVNYSGTEETRRTDQRVSTKCVQMRYMCRSETLINITVIFRNYISVWSSSLFRPFCYGIVCICIHKGPSGSYETNNNNRK